MRETNEPVMECISNNSIDGWTRLGRADCSTAKSVQRKAGKMADFFLHAFLRHCEKFSAAAKQHRDSSNFSQHLPRLKRGGVRPVPALILERCEVQTDREARAHGQRLLPALGERGSTGEEPNRT